MKLRPYQLQVLCIVTSILIIFPSCQKLIDYIRHHPGGDDDLKPCNIKTITTQFSTLPTTYTVHYNFTYNAYGNPVSMTNDLVETGNPNYSFIYDKKNRLIQFIKPYSGNTGYEEWFKYGYNDKGQIIRDTVYAFGAIVGGIPMPDTARYAYTDYTYDSQNRIIKLVFYYYYYHTLHSISTFDYAYDAKGNLVNPGTVYDDKLSIYRTNKIWMFITRNYSVNNSFTADRYNQFGLPVKLTSGFIALASLSGGKSVIEYMCD